MIFIRNFWLTLGILAAAYSTTGHAVENHFKIVSHIAVPDGRWDYIQIDPQHERAYLAHADRVTAIDLTGQTVIDNFAPGAQIHTALPINDGNAVLITNGANNTAVIVDAKTGAVEATIPTGTRPDAAIIDTATKLVLVMNIVSGDITLIDPTLQKAVGNISIGGALEEAAIDGKGLVYVNVENKNQTVVLDINARKIINRFDLTECNDPTGIAFTAKNQLIIACNGSAQVRSASDGKLIENFKIGDGADGIAYDEANHLAFVPSGATGTLSVITVDTDNPQLIETVNTQIGARTIAFDSKTGKIYLPTAKFGPKPSNGRAALVPGSFEILVLQRSD